MATLAEQRAAIAAGMRNSRAGTAASERQAIHDNMVARRTGEAIKENLSALEKPRRKGAELNPRAAKGGVPAVRSPGVPAPQPKGQAGGIAGPLVEITDPGGADTRTYHPPKTVISSDGLKAYQVQRVATLTMVDANNEEVALVFNDVP